MTQDDSPGSQRIDALWRDHVSLVEYLRGRGEWTLSGRVEEEFAKTLTIAAASYFEVELTEKIVGLYSKATGGVEYLSEFVRRQAIGRRFAQLFNWDQNGRPARNANSFYILFGGDFRDFMAGRVSQDTNLMDAVRAFIEIGSLRNNMVHGDYANFTLGKTAGEVHELYMKASLFLDDFPKAVDEFSGHPGQ